jgi:hypothetical protein
VASCVLQRSHLVGGRSESGKLNKSRREEKPFITKDSHSLTIHSLQINTTSSPSLLGKLFQTPLLREECRFFSSSFSPTAVLRPRFVCHRRYDRYRASAPPCRCGQTLLLSAVAFFSRRMEEEHRNSRFLTRVFILLRRRSADPDWITARKPRRKRQGERLREKREEKGKGVEGRGGKGSERER